MANATVTVEGQSDVGSVVSADMKRAQDAINQVSSSQVQAAASGVSLDKVMGTLGGTLGAIGLPLTAAGFAALAMQLDEVGGAAIRANNSLDAMTGGDAVSWTTSMQRATRGLMDDTDAANVATQLLSSGMATSSQEAAHFVQVATTLGAAIKGLDAKTASEEMANMFSSGNVRAAKDFGLSVIELRDRIKELKDADSGLTDQQALLTAFFEQADPLAARLAGTLNDQAAADKLKVAWSDLGETIGQAEATGLAPMQELGAGLLTTLNLMAQGMTLEAAVTQQSTSAKVSNVALTQQQAAAMEKAGFQIRNNQVGMSGLINDQTAYNNNTKQFIQMQVEAGAAVSASVDQMISRTKELTTAVDQYNAEVQQQAGITLNLLQNMGGYKDAFAAGTAAISQHNMAATESLAIYEALGLATGKVTTAQIDQANAMREMGNLLVSDKSLADEYATAWQNVKNGMNAATQEANLQSAAVNNLAMNMINQGVPASVAWATAQKEAQNVANGTTMSASEIEGMVTRWNTALINMKQPELIMFKEQGGEAIDGLLTSLKGGLDNINGTPKPNIVIDGVGQVATATTAIQKAVDVIAKLQDKTITVTVDYVETGTPPHNAAGTQDFSGGLTWVGEKGPELVALPPHAAIYPNGSTPGAMTGGASGGSAAPMGYTHNGDIYITAANGQHLNDLMLQAQQMQAGG